MQGYSTRCTININQWYLCDIIQKGEYYPPKKNTHALVDGTAWTIATNRVIMVDMDTTKSQVNFPKDAPA